MARFCRVFTSLASVGELGIVRIRSLIKMFGSSSGVVLEIRPIIASPNWENAWLKKKCVFYHHGSPSQTVKTSVTP